MTDKNPTIELITEALENSWSGETSYPGSGWSQANPARGQCVVSALVIQDYFGGDLRRYRVELEGGPEKHYVNVLDNGQVVSVSHSQYPENMDLVEAPIDESRYTSARQKVLSGKDTQDRYQILSLRVADYLERKED